MFPSFIRDFRLCCYFYHGRQAIVKDCFKDIGLSSTCISDLTKIFKIESIERLGR
jgi:hypothetical protein